MFGLFMLFGIVKKNGILQVDYTNVLRSQGLPRDEAILQANHTRLRPILMTTVMLIAAMIPIALGQGPGAASRASLAKGSLWQTRRPLTLLVTPVAYSYWDQVSRAGGVSSLGRPASRAPPPLNQPRLFSRPAAPPSRSRTSTATRDKTASRHPSARHQRRRSSG